MGILKIGLIDESPPRLSWGYGSVPVVRRRPVHLLNADTLLEEDTRATCIFVVKDTISILECSNFGITTFDTFFVGHARISNASWEEFFPCADGVIQSLLLGAHVFLRSAQFTFTLSKFMSSVLKTSLLGSDRHLSSTLELDEITLRLFLCGFGLGDGALEIGFDNVEHS